MREVVNAFELAASPAVTWALLTGTAAWPAWSPNWRGLRGVLQPGERAFLDVIPQRPWLPASYPIHVDTVDAERELCWSGPTTAGRWLLRASHQFLLSPLPQGGTRLVHGEQFTGPLVPLVWPLLGPLVAWGHGALNEALRQRLGTPG